MDKQAILAVFHQRHACKVYDANKKISEEDFRFILETGRLSPSSFGFEPWKFLVIENPKLRALIQQNAWGAGDKARDCSHFVVLIVRTGKVMSADGNYIQHMMRDVHHLPEEAIALRSQTYRKFVEQDFELANDERAFYDWACKQSYIAMGNMMTAAAMIGIDSTPIEGFPLETMNRLLVEQGLYHADEFKLSVMVAFGYRVNEARPKTRHTFDDVVEFIR